MVNSHDLCCAIEELLAIQYDKMYRTWKDQGVINLARSLAKQYRDETNSLPSENSLLLKAPESVSFEEGRVEEEFSTADPTQPDIVCHVTDHESFSYESIPSEVVPEKVNKSVYWDFVEPESVERVALYQRHPALPD